MKELNLSNSNLKAFVDDEDYERCSNYKWFLKLAYNNKPGRIVWTKRRKVSLSRFVLKLKLCEFNEIDHKDRNIFNNQKSNLRLCSRSENNTNKTKRIDNSSGYKGVSFHKASGKYRMSIKKDNKIIDKLFKTKLEAAMAYDDYAIELHGEFSVLNFPLYGA